MLALTRRLAVAEQVVGDAEARIDVLPVRHVLDMPSKLRAGVNGPAAMSCGSTLRLQEVERARRS